MPARTVLLVEDDDAFRYALARRLTEAGLRVVEAKDSMAALREIDRGLAFGCLITDVQMPAGAPHGLALANMLRARRPNLVVLFVTAYPELATATQEAWEADAVFLKPVDLEALTATVKEKLAAVYPPDPAHTPRP